jgi:hypothetical protein
MVSYPGIETFTHRFAGPIKPVNSAKPLVLREMAMRYLMQILLLLAIPFGVFNALSGNRFRNLAGAPRRLGFYRLRIRKYFHFRICC